MISLARRIIESLSPPFVDLTEHELGQFLGGLMNIDELDSPLRLRQFLQTAYSARCGLLLTQRATMSPVTSPITEKPSIFDGRLVIAIVFCT